MKTYSYLILLILAFTSCSSDEVDVCEENCDINASSSEMMIIESYLQQNNLTAQQTCQGVYYIITNEGNENKPNRCSEIIIHYEGRLLNGEIFDSSYDNGSAATLSLGGVIEGWRSALPLFGEGGTGTIIIPPSLGYGSSGQNTIPGNATLIFDIDLKSVN